MDSVFMGFSYIFFEVEIFSNNKISFQYIKSSTIIKIFYAFILSISLAIDNTLRFSIIFSRDFKFSINAMYRVSINKINKISSTVTKPKSTEFKYPLSRYILCVIVKILKCIIKISQNNSRRLTLLVIYKSHFTA